MFPFQLRLTSLRSWTRNPTPELQYPPSPIPFTASPEPIPYLAIHTLEPQAILSRQPTPPLPPPNFELMEYQLHHPRPCHASPTQLCALANLGGGQLEIMVQELVQNPDGSLDEIYPWDRDCLVRAALHQMETAPFHISIIEGDDHFVTSFRNLPHLLPLQHQRKQLMEIEIAPRHLQPMNLEKVYLQLVMPLQMETVHLTESRIVIPFRIQVGETGAKTPICALHYADETIGQTYEAAGWAFSAATLEDNKSFTIHDQGWEIFRRNLFPPNYANIQLVKSKFPNYLPNYRDWIRDADGGWDRGVPVEE